MGGERLLEFRLGQGRMGDDERRGVNGVSMKAGDWEIDLP